MENSPSIRSFSRARIREGGFALALALIVAVLYFGLMQLMLFDAARELTEARRFRARVVALTLAENGAELAAQNMALDTIHEIKNVQWPDEQGIARGLEMRKVQEGAHYRFTIKANGETEGVIRQTASVDVHGRVVRNGAIYIDYTRHSQ